MPTTYNGIGTRYYGEKNVQTRSATCRSCNRQVVLRSYDTRLWFVVIYIPIIPLGRKRITDFCPACRRHYVADLHKWETAKQLDVSGALQEYQQNPNPDTAIKAHQLLIGYRQYAEATEFRKLLQPQFHDNARVQAYMGDVLSELGQAQEGLPYYRRALELRPDLPQAKMGVARDAIRQGKLDEARKLIDFLEQPGAGQLYPLVPVELLGNAFQNARRHAEALEMYGVLVKELPAVVQHENFRKKVKVSERALGQKTSLLPKKKFSLRGLFSRKSGTTGSGKTKLLVVGATAVIFAMVMAGVNEYTRRHRTLYIVNAYKKPATVTIDGVGTVQVGHARASMIVPEGKWQAHITGPVEQTVAIELDSDYFDRWSGSPVWVLNVGGASLLTEIHEHYSKSNPPPADLGFFFGDSFLALPQLDHPFEDLPDHISVDSNDTTVKTLTNLTISTDKPADVFDYLIRKGRKDEAIRLAEWDLKSNPYDYEMLDNYSSNVDKPHLIKFLKEGLSHRPVSIDWHRMYQNLVMQSESDNLAMIATYDAMLKNEPDDSALLYLRGRLSQDPAESTTFYNRALKADPNNAFALYATGYDAFSAGDWKASLPLFMKASSLRSDSALFASMVVDNQFALGDYSSVEKDARARLAKNPADLNATTALIHSLVAQGRLPEAEKTVSAYEKIPGINEAMNAVSMVRFAYWYDSKNPQEMEKAFRNDTSTLGRQILCVALVEQGRMEEAEQMEPFAKSEEGNAYDDLARGTEWLLKGDREHASPWLERAGKTLATGYDKTGQCAARILAASPPPTREEMTALLLPPAAKAIVAASLALQHPEQAKMFADIAKQFNVAFGQPRNLIERTVAKAGSAP